MRENGISATAPPIININRVFHLPINGLNNEPTHISASELKKICIKL
jgi:hypothetical protein